mgnify:CR=1 FL=1
MVSPFMYYRLAEVNRMIENGNLYNRAARFLDKEITETLISQGAVRIERIISTGQCSPNNFWYDQAENEWVCVLQGEGVIEWQNGSRNILKPGDWVFVPPHEKHRVHSTTSKPPCIWLAFFWQK